MIFLKVVWLYFIVLKSRFKVERRPSSAFPRVHQGVRDFSRDNCAKIEYHLKQLDYFEIIYYVTTNHSDKRIISSASACLLVF